MTNSWYFNAPLNGGDLLTALNAMIAPAGMQAFSIAPAILNALDEHQKREGIKAYNKALVDADGKMAK
jgi:hypothetical protein